MTVAIAAA